MTRLVALMTVVFATVLISKPAAAQDQTWLTDRQYREGAGFRTGDFELHPGIGADFGYDSNYFRRHSSEEPVGSLRIRVSPHFSVATLGPQRRGDGPPPSTNFRFEVGGTYNEFIPVSGPDAGQDRLQDQRNIGGDAKLSLDIMPQRVWSGRIYGGVGRTVQPTNEGDLTTSFNRVLPTAGAELAWAPGSGLVDWRLGYVFTGTFFESAVFSGLNNFRNDITTRGRWRFLPRTALMYDASFGFMSYPDGSSMPTAKTSSYPMRSRIGLNGLITPSFAALALVGWGASFYAGDGDNVHDFDSVIAQAEVKWYLSPPPTQDPTNVSGNISALAVGFIRDFQDSFVGTYLERDQGYVKFNYLFGGAFLLVAEVRGGAVVFPAQDPALTVVENHGGWADFRMDGTLFGEWRIIDSVGVNAEFGYTGYFSDNRLVYDIGGGGRDALGYQNIRAFIGGRWFM